MAARAECRCGHPADMHEHYRPGTDCGECGAFHCPAYGPGLTWHHTAGIAALSQFAIPTPMTGEEAMPEQHDPEAAENPAADTAGEQDHTDPWAYAGDNADAPTDPDGAN